MSEPKKVDRRKFIYAGLGAALVVLGVTALVVTRPPEVITQTTTVPTTSVVTITVPTTSVVTTTVPTTTPSSGKVTITFWHGHTGPDGKVLESIVKDFMSTHPNIEIVTSAYSWGELMTKAEIAVAGGSGPDLLSAIPSVMYPYKDILAKPIDDLLDQLDISQWDPKTTLDFTKWEGKRYGIPFAYPCYVTYLRRDVFEKKGIDLPSSTKPLTKDEFLNLAIKLTKPEENLYACGFKQLAHHAYWDWHTFFAQFGVTWLSMDLKKCQLNSEDAFKALQFLIDLVEKYKVAPKKVAGWSDYFADFMAGRIAMFVHGTWCLSDLLKAKTPYSVIPVPLLGNSLEQYADPHVLFFTRIDPNRTKAALEFVKYFLSPSVIYKWSTVAGNPVFIKDARNRPEYKESNLLQVATYEMSQNSNKSLLQYPYHKMEYTALYKFIIPTLEAIWRNEIPIENGLNKIASDVERLVA
jgi:multiple sugar transport system substrate-binding protein